MKSKIFFALTLLAGTSGCNKLLDVEPSTFTSGSNYYQTEQQIKTAVSGAYSTLQDLNGSRGQLYIFTEVRSDNSTFQYNPNQRCCITREQSDEFLNTSSDRFTENLWSVLYNGIQQTNVILGRIDDVTFIDDEKKNQYIAEAKFLRSFLYFNLVRLFGEVPLIVEEVEGPSDAFTSSRAAVDEVYAQVIQDATDAAASLPVSYTGADIGRATKGAALTLLGDLYLTRKDYANAITTLEQVTQLGYSLVPEYSNVFDPNNKNNTESVFEVQYNAGVEGESSSFFFDFAPFTSGMALTGFQGQPAALNIPTMSIVDAYEPGDKRKDASIGFYTDPLNTSIFETYPGDSIPYIKKYYHPPYEINGRSNDNWPVYRYSHVLLMLAEALNEEGRTGDAYAYINPVRQRAGLNILSGLSADDFRKAAYQEERVELAFEDKRWYDLLRTGRAIEVMTAHGVEERARFPRVGPESFNMQEYMMLLPIPASEVRLNGYPQNPNY